MLQALAPSASRVRLHVAGVAARGLTGRTRRAVAAAHAPARPGRRMRRTRSRRVAIARTIGSPVVVAGSLYLAGEIRANLT